MNTLRIPQSARLVSDEEADNLTERLAQRAAWLKACELERIRRKAEADERAAKAETERQARIQAARERFIEWCNEQASRPSNVVRLEDAR